LYNKDIVDSPENQKQIRIRKPRPREIIEPDQEHLESLVAAMVGVIVMKAILEVEEAHSGD